MKGSTINNFVMTRDINLNFPGRITPSGYIVGAILHMCAVVLKHQIQKFVEVPQQILESMYGIYLGNFSEHILRISKDKTSKMGMTVRVISNSDETKGVCLSQDAL